MKILFFILCLSCITLISIAQTFSGVTKDGDTIYLRIHPDSSALLVNSYGDISYDEDTGAIKRINDTLFKLTVIDNYREGVEKGSNLKYSSRECLDDYRYPPACFGGDKTAPHSDCDSIEIIYPNGKKEKGHYRDDQQRCFTTDGKFYSKDLRYYINLFHKNPFTNRYYLLKVGYTTGVAISSDTNNNDWIFCIKNNQVTPGTHLLMQSDNFVLKKIHE